MQPTQPLFLKAFSSVIPLLVAIDGITKGRFRLMGPIRMSAGGHIRRHDNPIAFWVIAVLLALMSIVIGWVQFVLLGD